MNEMYAMDTMHDANGAKLKQLNRVVSRAATTALACAIGDASAQCQYSVQVQAPWACTPTFLNNYTGTGLNNLGGWCGHRKMCWSNEGEGDVAVYCPPGGSPAKLPLPPNAGPKGAKAYAVNDAGVVVGASFEGPNGVPEKGCIWWPDGSVTVIPIPPGGSRSTAESINTSGVIAGSTGANPFVWSDGEMKIIPQPPGLGAGGATRISDGGVVIGTFGSTATNSRGFRWKDGELELLPPLAPHPISSVYGVNSAGVVVGASTTFQWPGGGYLHRPTMWVNSEPIALPLPAGYSAGGCYDINDAGVIVGFAQPGWSTGGGAIYIAWINGVPYKLTDLVGGTVSIGESRHLNQIGQILSTSGAKVLSPIDPPPIDLNGDCAVDGSDLMKLLSEWGPRDFSVADFNHDGIVNGADLAQVLGNWTGSK